MKRVAREGPRRPDQQVFHHHGIARPVHRRIGPEGAVRVGSTPGPDLQQGCDVRPEGVCGDVGGQGRRLGRLPGRLSILEGPSEGAGRRF